VFICPALRDPWLGTLCLLSSLGWLWLGLIRHLAPEWTLNEQYQYGWAVPALVVVLLCRRVGRETSNSKLQTSKNLQGSNFNESGACADGATVLWRERLFLPVFFLGFVLIRLIQEANPEWRFVSWALALIVIGVTLVVLKRFGSRWQTFLFPLLFFLIAVPWPTFIEAPVIQGLMRINTLATVEVLGWFGIPAIPRGNVLELASGVVGVDEACSGIRSLQATLMLALLFGEWRMLNWTRRIGLMLAAVGFALVFNFGRTLLLVSVAARQGIPAMARWHDPAGVVIILGCFVGLWWLSRMLSRSRPAKRDKFAPSNRQPDAPAQTSAQENQSWSVSLIRETLTRLKPVNSMTAFAFGLFTVLLVSEVGVESWYRWHEAKLSPIPQWTVVWPRENSTFRQADIPRATRRILRFDEGTDASWSENGARWQAIALMWKPGRTALHLAQGHTPDVCLTAAGHKLEPNAELKRFEVNGLSLPFRCYTVADGGQTFHVFYCLWDERTATGSFSQKSMTYGTRLAPVLAGIRNPGQRSLELAIWGYPDKASAEGALTDQLLKLIHLNLTSNLKLYLPPHRF
jgi:exosortase